MSPANRPVISKVANSDKGIITVEGPTASEKISNYGINDGLRAFRPAWRQKEALVEIAADDGWIVTAINQNIIVGYIAFHPPGEFERWSEAANPKILELGAIEVAPDFRNIRLGKEMMQVAFTDPIIENYIIISTEYCWHWDLEGTRLGLWEYRNMMTRLMQSVGMVKMDTDDPEIGYHPANMLMVRIGSKVSPEDIAAFHALLFKNI